MNKPIKVIIVGAGHRSLMYASYAKKYPNEMQIVGVAEPNEERRQMVKELYKLPDEMCFESAEKLAEAGKLADAVINGTMDALHVPTSIPLLRAGYDILLEKPFAINENEVHQLEAVVNETGRRVMVCHVLRYSPFYVEIKKRLNSGVIGDIINIQMSEHVSYHHTAVSYVRGKWASELVCGAPMLLAKSCHDVDLLCWMMADVKPSSIQSFGSDFQFTPDKKPANAGTKCLVDCPLEVTCKYSARKLYLTPPFRWGFYVWDGYENLDMAGKEESLKRDNPYGRCVWDCKRDGNVDHQTVNIAFENGATASFNMIGGAAKPERNIHIVGTNGEIKGNFESSIYTVRTIDADCPSGYCEETVDLNIVGDKTGEKGGHGGGDMLVPADFVRYINGEETSISCTALSVSVRGHMAVFRAEQSRKENRIIEFE